MKKYLYFALAVATPVRPPSRKTTIRPRQNLYVFWQPDRPLTPADFQKSDSLSELNKYMYDSCRIGCVASVGLWTQADAPKRKKWTREHGEKIYVVPAFEKGDSYIIHNDTAGIAHEQIIFDLHEVGARLLRFKLQRSNGNNGPCPLRTQALLFKTYEAEIRKFVKEMTYSFSISVLVEKNDSLARWRAMVDDCLEKYADYATRPEDCARFILNKPLLDGYSTIKMLQGDFNNEIPREILSWSHKASSQTRALPFTKTKSVGGRSTAGLGYSAKTISTKTDMPDPSLYAYASGKDPQTVLTRKDSRPTYRGPVIPS